LALASEQKSPPGQQMMSVSSADVRRGEAERLRAPARASDRSAARRQHQVLVVRHAHLAEAELVGEVGDRSICSSVMSPGAMPVRFSDSVTRGSPAPCAARVVR
jgi:hypothetical protein